MTYAQSLRSLVQSLTRNSRRDRAAHAGKFTPRMELLEDLTLPSTISWINPAGGDWATPGNWSANRVPGPGDDVLIDLPGNYTVTHSTGNHTVNNILSYRNFRMSGGSLRVAMPSSMYGPVSMTLGVLTVDNMLTVHRTMDFTGGTIQGNGDLDLRGLLTWSGGLMSGSGRTHTREGINFTFTGNNGLDTRTLNNYGLVQWTGTGSLNFRGGVFNNMAGAVFVVRNTATFVGDHETRAGVFNNSGIFRVDAGAANFLRQVNQAGVVFNNFRDVYLNGGDMTLARGGINRGLLQVNSTRNLVLPGEMFILDVGSRVAGQGWVRVHGATVQVSTPVQVGSLEVSRGLVEATGSVTVNGQFLWSGGTVRAAGFVQVNGGMTISGAADKLFADGTLRNTGTATWTGSGALLFEGAGGFVNTPGATFHVQTNSLVSFGTAFNGFHNQGTFRKSAGGVTTFVGGLVNRGTVALDAGRLEITAIDSSAALTLGAGTTLTADVLITSPTSRLTGAGDVQIVNFTSQVEGTYDITGETYVVGAVAFVGDVRTGSLRNQGLVVAGPTGSLTVTGNYVQETGAGTYLGNGVVTVGGLLDLQGGALGGTGTIHGNVRNAGRFIVGDGPQVGRITINGNYTQTADGILDLEIGSAEVGYDQLVVNGHATLDGTLNIMLLDGFAANLDDNYGIVHFRSAEGRFATINGLELGGGLYFDPVYGETGLALWIIEA